MDYSSEIKLIQRWLSSGGRNVQDVQYHKDLFIIGAPGIQWIGQRAGLPLTQTFFFGTVHYWIELYTIANLALQNKVRVLSGYQIYDGLTWTATDMIFAVNHQLTLLGDGTYSGNRRIYNCGFNFFNVSVVDFDPLGTFMAEMTVDGLLFIIA